MKKGDRVKGRYCYQDYTGVIVSVESVHGEGPVYLVKFDREIEGRSSAMIYSHDDTIEPDKSLSNKIKGLERLNLKK